MPPSGTRMAMPKLHERIYLANAVVLLVHQMDAAYWHEWTLFGMPGGLQLYLLLNVPITLVVLAGYGALAAGRRCGIPASAGVALAGMFAAGFHGVHLWRGDPSFRSPASFALLGSTLVLSLAQAGCVVWLVRPWRKPGSFA